MVASAGILTMFGQTEVTANVEQSVLLDGIGYDAQVEGTEFDICAGCVECVEHTITNNGCEGIWLDWEHTGDPTMEGIDVQMVEKCEGSGGGCCDHILETLEVVVLDGMAEWDDFDVYVDGVRVYSYMAFGGDPETWITHTIDLTSYEIQCCGPHTIKIECSATTPWEHFNPYGQLAVDYVALYCENNVICDEVDIGNPTSEAGHNPQGWGPIEPANTGGAYGGVDNCRCTWFWTDGDDLSMDWDTVDNTGATIELVCEDCYEEEPEGCYGCPIIETPFYLGPGEELDFCLCYHFDMRIIPGTYHIASQLIPSDAL